MEGTTRHKVLIVGPESAESLGVDNLLDRLACDVLWRTSRHEVLPLLTAATTDLLILNYVLGDDSGADFCKMLRGDNAFANLKIVMIGSDNDQARNAVESLNAGADDFITLPFPKPLFEARVKRLLPRAQQNRSSLSVNVEGNELPGILSFLEAEIKTGRLEVRHGKVTAMIYIHEGRLVNGKAPGCEGLDAVVEALSFPSSHVTFHEEPVPEEDRAFSLESTGTIMNCVFEVDEFREAQRELPKADAQFAKTDKSPAELDERQRKVLQALVSGKSIEQVLNSPDMGERHATMALMHLIREEFVTVLPGPFEHYFRRAAEFYSQRALNYLERKTGELRDALKYVSFPLAEPSGRLQFTEVDWMSPAPRLLITGTNPEHVKMLLHAYEQIHIAVNHTRPMTRKIPGNARATRFQFGEKRELEVIALPSRLGPIINHWTDVADDAFALVQIVSSQDDKTLRETGEQLRTLRRHFSGIYYFIVPQILDPNGNPTFNVSCRGCGFTLSADIRYTGAEGECPVCNASFAFPDCLDHLADALYLPLDVPIVQLKPDAPTQAADLLRMIFDSVEQLNQPLPDPGQTQSVVMRSPEIAEHTEVRERTVVDHHPPSDDAISLVPDDDETDEPPQHAPTTPPVAAARTTPAAPADDDAGEYFQERDTLDELLSTGIFSDKKNADNDDFDLDDFIRSVR